MRCVRVQLAVMSPRARVGQLFLLGMPADGSARDASVLARSAPGGVFLTGRGSAGTAATARLLAEAQHAARGGGGAVGAILTGVFAAPSLGGTGIFDYVANKVSPDYSIPGQVWIQFQAVITTVVWSGVVAFIAYKLVERTVVAGIFPKGRWS